MSAHLAQAAGTLERTPFADLLIQAHDARATGTLVLEEPGGKRHGVYFHDGQPERARVVTSGAHLGELLVERGALSADLQQETLARARVQHVLYGQLLVAEGIVAEDALRDALREQLMRKLVSLFGQPQETKFGYFDRTNYLAHWGAPAEAPLELLELLWLGIRDHARGFEIDCALSRWAGRRLELRRDLPENHFAFLGPDHVLVAGLREHPMRMAELLGRHAQSLDRIRRVLYFLIVSRSLALGIPSAPPLGLTRDETPQLPPAPRVPGFATETPPPHANDAAPNTTETREFAHLLGGQLAFHKAESLLARGELTAALREAARAFEHDPTKPEHIALRAYVALLQPESDGNKVLAELDRAAESPQASAKVHWYRGLALKRLGRHASALQEFRTVLEENPRDIDAAREVHIYETRLRKSGRHRLSLAPEPERKPSQIFDWALQKWRPRH